MGENIHSDDIIYVAVNQDVGESESTLLWTLKNLKFKMIVLLHIHALFSITTSSCPFDQSEIDAIKESQVEELNNSFDKYRDICTNNGVNKKDVNIARIRGYSVGKGIVKLIKQNNIKKLVMGAAANPHYFKKMSIKSRKAKYVSENAPRGCKMWFICKGKLITTKEGSVDHGNPREPSKGRGRVADSSPDPPHDFICPITLLRIQTLHLKQYETMQDPHFAADGYTYEAEAFREYLSRGGLKSLRTNEKLENHNLTPNDALRLKIKDWLKKNPHYKID